LPCLSIFEKSGWTLSSRATASIHFRVKSRSSWNVPGRRARVIPLMWSNFPWRIHRRRFAAGTPSAAAAGVVVTGHMLSRPYHEWPSRPRSTHGTHCTDSPTRLGSPSRADSTVCPHKKDSMCKAVLVAMRGLVCEGCVLVPGTEPSDSVMFATAGALCTCERPGCPSFGGRVARSRGQTGSAVSGRVRSPPRTQPREHPVRVRQGLIRWSSRSCAGSLGDETRRLLAQPRSARTPGPHPTTHDEDQRLIDDIACARAGGRALKSPALPFIERFAAAQDARVDQAAGHEEFPNYRDPLHCCTRQIDGQTIRHGRRVGETETEAVTLLSQFRRHHR
jgi:hypothetical protein